MPFFLPKNCREFFSDIYGGKNDEMKLKLLFDEYYFCLMVGLAQAKYNDKAELESSEVTDEYPSEYANCKDYIAGLLIATEAKLQGITENDADDLERLMMTYVDSHSKTRLNSAGERRLNQYAARGYDIMRSRMLGRHRHLEEFLLDYFECFENGEFLR